MDLFKKWGISVSSTDDEVRHVYRLYVQKMHPDRVGNSKENQDAFCRLQDEYTLLKTSAKRQAYWNELQAARQPPPQEYKDEANDKVKIMTAGGVVPPSPLHIAVPIPLTLASTGGKMQVIVKYTKPCSCGRKRSCKMCKGTGQVWGDKKIRLFVEAGTPDGAVIVLPGEGHQGTFETGDLHVELEWANPFGWTWNKTSARLEKSLIVPPFLLGSSTLVTRLPNGILKKIAFKNTQKSSSGDKIYSWIATQDGFKKGFVIVKPSWLGFAGLFNQLFLRAKMALKKGE